MNSQYKEMLQQAIHSFNTGNFDRANSILNRVIRVDTKNFFALHLLGLIKASQANYREAVDFLGRAARINPKDAHIQYNLAKALSDYGLDKESIPHHKKAVELAPSNPEAWLNYGKSASNMYNCEGALDCYDKALSLKPDYHEAWTNKGVTLHDLKRFDEAIAHYDKALSLKPDYAEGWSNKGFTLHDLKRFDEAIAHYDKALSLKPNYHIASWNKSLSLLLRGDFENGFPLYESRWDLAAVGDLGERFFGKPVWLGGESLRDKTILIYGEQGLGDFIQFCRYVKLVAELGATVILKVPQTLAGLMENLEGVSKLLVKGEELPFFDYECPLLSLPVAFKTNLHTIPNAVGYINLNNHPDKIMEWKARLGLKLKPRVGLVWSGNHHHKNDHNRSLLLREFLPFLSNQFEYISLQKEVREVDKLTLDLNPHILSYASDLNDFLDTAALIDNLDLVISVDTSVAHLSGALGRKTWLLLPYVPDWRWLLDMENSPWYPSMKLFRQPAISDWNSVLHQVKFDLNCGLSIDMP